MRRLYHDTTALVTCFALIAAQGAWVQGAWAQQAADAAPAVEETAPEAAQNLQNPVVTPAAPIAESKPQATQTPTETPAPAAEPEAPVTTPSEAPAPVVDTSTTAETPTEAQPTSPTEPAMPSKAPAKANEAPPAATEAPADPPNKTVDEAPLVPSETPAPVGDKPAAAETPTEAQPASPTEPATTSEAPAEASEAPPAVTEVPVETPKTADEAASETPAPVGDKPAAAETPTEAQPASPTEAATTSEAPAETSEAQPAVTEAPIETPKTADEAASEMPAPVGDKPAATETPTEAQTATPPETAAPSETPAPVEIPEAGLAPSEEALSAASETSPASASALEETAAPPAPEQEITTEEARSSSTDLAAPLTQQKASGTAKKAKDDSLSKALLLGAGALAVGAILSNNRAVALSTPDRVVLERPDGSYQVLKDEDALLHQSGAKRSTQTFPDGSTRSLVRRTDGSQIVTYRDKDLRLLRRDHIAPDGQVRRLIDETLRVEPIDIATLPAPVKPLDVSPQQSDEETLRRALSQQANAGRHFSLAQIRSIPEVRALVAPISIDTITFNTGSAAIDPDQARSLSSLGRVIQGAIKANPREIFLIEGHTDTTGAAAVNLALSDRRAESLALALTEYFDVPPENLVIQGYGENFLKVRAEGNIRANRRAAVRRITDLLMPTN